MMVVRNISARRLLFSAASLLALLTAIFLNWGFRHHFGDFWIKMLAAAAVSLPLAAGLQALKDRFFPAIPARLTGWILIVTAVLVILLPSGKDFIIFLMLLLLAGAGIFYRFRFDTFLPSPVADKKPDYNVIAFYVIFFLFLLLLLRTAWIAEDAFITFRTVRNFLHGFGLRYNIYERVQSYTHPLWFFVISAVALVTDEYPYTVGVFSIFLSLVTVMLAIRFFHHSWKLSALFLGLLFCSKAFMDYTSSGLENPLSYFLVWIIYWFWFNREPGLKRFFYLCLFSAFLAVNRHDLGLLAAPLLIADFIQLVRQKPSRFFTLAGLAVAGFFPLIAWTAFSLVYYGFPFPNTAYAKLSTGIPRAEYLAQGVVYFLDSLMYDPVTLVSVFLIAGMAFFYKARKTYILLAGIALYFIYLLRIGGDFMSGRFFSVPFFCAALLLLQVKPGKAALWVFTPVFALLALASPYSPPKYFFSFSSQASGIRSTGITDERAFYYEPNGIMNFQRITPVNENIWQKAGREYRDTTWMVQPWENIGMTGFYSDEDIHIVDFLCDPLLARLPMDKRNRDTWRIGHFYREIPAGYLETLTYLDNRLEDPGLHEYYNHLVVLTQQEDLFHPERLQEIVRFNLGRYDHLVKPYEHPVP